MKAMVIDRICNLKEERDPLRYVEMPAPRPRADEVLIQVSACGICHTELDEIEGRTPPPRFPMVPGHQIVGIVAERGSAVKVLRVGDRVGVAWIHWACGSCRFCLAGNENLCDDFRATGRDVNGGYAQFAVVAERFAFPIPGGFDDFEAAPLLCAGSVGYRSVRLAAVKDGENVGLVGFGASAHLVLQMIRHKYPASKVFVFARNASEREFAIVLGAYWAGDMTELSPSKLHCAIDTTPVWRTVMHALKNLEKGGRLVINAIRKEHDDRKALLDIDYAEHLWFEKEVKTVANVTSRDVREFLEVAAKIPIKPQVQKYDLEQANEALVALKEGRIRGAKVLGII